MHPGNFILLFYFGCTFVKAEFSYSTKQAEIFPDDYDKFEPPWSKGNPAHVYVQLSVMDIDKIDDGAMEYSIQSYLGEIWKDTRLNLSIYQNNESYNPIFPTYLVQYIWVPDLVFDNTKNGMLFHLSLPNTNIKVLKDGTFLRSSRYNFLIGCQMDFHLYPMDTQKCYLKISTMSNPDFKVLLHWYEEYLNARFQSVLTTSKIEPLKYAFLKPESYKSTEVWASGNYTYLYANFTFVRRLSGTLFNVYVPSTLVVSLSWISFWLAVEAVPARITLGVTSLLTLATQMVQAHAGLPAISYMTAVDVWLFVCLITVFCSLIEYAFSYHMHILRKQQSSINALARNSIDVKPKTELRLLRTHFNNGVIYCRPLSWKQDSQVSHDLQREWFNQESLDSLCRKVFPILFSLFAIIYWTYYLCMA